MTRTSTVALAVIALLLPVVPAHAAEAPDAVQAAGGPEPVPALAPSSTTFLLADAASGTGDMTADAWTLIDLADATGVQNVTVQRASDAVEEIARSTSGAHAGKAPGGAPTRGPASADAVTVPRPLGALRVLHDVWRTLLLLLQSVGFAFLALAHRFRGAESLENESRRRILDAVQDTPGAHATALARQVDMHPKTLAYHLRVLASTRHVTLERDGKFLRAFPEPRDPAPRPTYIGDGTRRAVLALVVDEGVTTRQALADRLGLTPQAVSYHLTALEREGLVVRHRRHAERIVDVAPAPEVARAV